MERPIITRSCVKPMFETGYLSVYDLQYEEGRHYYDATRRRREDICAVKTLEEFQAMTPDAVSCFVIIERPQAEPLLLLNREFRFPAGQVLLSVPAGLIDERDREDGNAQEACLRAAAREIKEETGLEIGEKDSLHIVSPAVFSTPGMTDESNALVLAVLRPEDPDFLKKNLTQSGAEEQEKFDGFRLLTKMQAKKLLVSGRDEDGIFFPVYSWMAMLYFVSGLWQEAAGDAEP